MLLIEAIDATLQDIARDVTTVPDGVRYEAVADAFRMFKRHLESKGSTSTSTPTAIVTGNKAIDDVLRFFKWEHLPENLQEPSKRFATLAYEVAQGPQVAETTVALRKLLEAKDAAVRAILVSK